MGAISLKCARINTTPWYGRLVIGRTVLYTVLRYNKTAKIIDKTAPRPFPHKGFEIQLIPDCYSFRVAYKNNRQNCWIKVCKVA